MPPKARKRFRYSGPEVPKDFYPTPWEATAPLMDFLASWVKVKNPVILDPFSGPGLLLHWSKSLRRQYLRIAVDIHRGLADAARTLADASFCADSLVTGWDFFAPEGLVITNPPYCLTEQAMAAALDYAAAGGVVAMLVAIRTVQTDYFTKLVGGVHRLPQHLVLLPFRPSFDGVGNDYATYCWAIWDKLNNHSPIRNVVWGTRYYPDVEHVLLHHWALELGAHFGVNDG